MVIAMMTFSVPVPRTVTIARARMIRRECDEDVDDPLEEDVELPTEIGARDPDEEPDGGPEERAGEADQHRGPRPPHEAGEDVAAELVGAEPMTRVRWDQHRPEVIELRVVRRDPGGEERGHHHDEDDEGARNPERLRADDGPQPALDGRSLEDFVRYESAGRHRHGRTTLPFVLIPAAPVNCSGFAGRTTRRRDRRRGSSPRTRRPPASRGPAPGCSRGRSPRARRADRGRSG